MSATEPAHEPAHEPAREPGPAAGPGALPYVPEHVSKDIFRSALRATLALLVVLAVVGVGVGYLVDGSAGVWGAALGVGVSLLFSGSTIASMLYTADKSPTTMMAVLMGVWIVKMVVLVAVLAVLGQLDFYHRLVFAVVVLVGVVGSAALDMYSVVKGRQPYISG